MAISFSFFSEVDIKVWVDRVRAGLGSRLELSLGANGASEALAHCLQIYCCRLLAGDTQDEYVGKKFQKYHTLHDQVQQRHIAAAVGRWVRPTSTIPCHDDQ